MLSKFFSCFEINFNFFLLFGIKTFYHFFRPVTLLSQRYLFPFVGKKRSEKVETLAEHNFQLAEVSIKPHQNHTFTFPKMKIVIEQWERKRPISQFEDEIFFRQKKKIHFHVKMVWNWMRFSNKEFVNFTENCAKTFDIGLLNHFIFRFCWINFTEKYLVEMKNKSISFWFRRKKSLAHCNITETYLITYFMHKKVLGRIYLWVWYPKIVYMSPAASCSAY